MPKEVHYKILNSLGTFFTRLENKDLVLRLIQSKTELINEVYQRMLNLYYGHFINKADYFRRYGFAKLELKYAKTEAGYAYYKLAEDPLDEANQVIYIANLYTSIDVAEAKEIKDFSLIEEDSLKYLKININELETPPPETLVLYTTMHGMSEDYLYESFAKFLGISKEKDSLRYLVKLQCLWNSLILQKNLKMLESVIAALCNLPIAFDNGQVIAISNDRKELTIKYDSLGTITHKAEPNVLFKPYLPNDPISKFENLASNLKIYDFRTNLEAFARNIEIRKAMSPGLPVRTFYMVKKDPNEIEHYYVFNNFDAQIGNDVIINLHTRRVINLVDLSFVFPTDPEGFPILRSGNFAELNNPLPLSNFQEVDVYVIPSEEQFVKICLRGAILVLVYYVTLGEFMKDLFDFLTRITPLYTNLIMYFISVDKIDSIFIQDEKRKGTLILDLTDRMYSPLRIREYGAETFVIDDWLIYRQA
ncbi:MAG: hypothetical protein QXS37_06310 [Candidatus Aenigmatarchaeota archaeon]